MKVYYLLRPTEKELQREEAAFEELASQYRETLQLIQQKKEGRYCMGFPVAVLEQHAEQQRLEAFHKIPTHYQVELYELLAQNHITVC